MNTHIIEKALEVWTLQNLLNFSIYNPKFN